MLLYEGCREFSGEAGISAANNRVKAVGVLYLPSLVGREDSTGVVGSSTSFSTVGIWRGVEIRGIVSSVKRADLLEWGVEERWSAVDMADSLRMEPEGEELRAGVLRAALRVRLEGVPEENREVGDEAWNEELGDLEGALACSDPTNVGDDVAQEAGLSYEYGPSRFNEFTRCWRVSPISDAVWSISSWFIAIAGPSTDPVEIVEVLLRGETCYYSL